MIVLPTNVIQDKEPKYYSLHDKLQSDNNLLLKRNANLNNEINQFRLTSNTLKSLIQQKEEEIAQLEQSLGIQLKDIYTFNKLEQENNLAQEQTIERQ